MGDENDFLQYLKLQDEPALLTKSELLEYVRGCGVAISARQLTSYTTEHVVPKSVRIGSRAGAYPRIVAELVVWVVRSRRRGLSIDAIRELVPLWRFLRGQLNGGSLDLMAFQDFVRDRVSLPEAVFAVPSVLHACMVCSRCGRPLVEGLKVIDKDSAAQLHDAEHPATIGFLVLDQDEDDAVHRVASSSFVLPVVNRGDEPTTILLGLPAGIDLPALHGGCEDETPGVGADA